LWEFDTRYFRYGDLAPAAADYPIMIEDGDAIRRDPNIAFKSGRAET
jgi:hypothetical protein